MFCLIFRCVKVCTDGGYDYAGMQYGSQCICTNTGPQGNSEEGRCTYGCAGDNSIKMCGGLGYINMFHTDEHNSITDDRGCGNSAQDLYYQKWYADMSHCEAEEVIDDVAEELEKLNITSEYRASLAWMSTADLDIYVRHVETGEVIFYGDKYSDDGNTYLDVDQLGGQLPADGKTHVENVSFNRDGTFEVYANNHNSKGDVDEIPFTVVTKMGTQTRTFHDSWNIGEMGTVTNGDLGRMMKITTINVEGSA